MVAGIFTWIQAQQLGQRSGELSGTAETQLETVLRTGGGHQNSSGKSAGDESRTRDLNVGNVALYQLSYSRAAKAL